MSRYSANMHLSINILKLKIIKPVTEQCCYSISPWLTLFYQLLHHCQYEAQIAVGVFGSLSVCALCGNIKMQPIRKTLAFQTAGLTLLPLTQQEMVLSQAERQTVMSYNNNENYKQSRVSLQVRLGVNRLSAWPFIGSNIQQCLKLSVFDSILKKSNF